MAAKPAKFTAPKAQPVAADKARRKFIRHDWEAVERDFRTGQLSKGELAAKYNMAAPVLSRQIAKDQKQDPTRWKGDLSEAVRLATKAAVMAETVKSNINLTIKNGQIDVHAAVQAAALSNTQVIMAHRTDLQRARQAASDMLGELVGGALLVEHRELIAQVLAGDGAEPIDVSKARDAIQRAMGLATRIGGIKSLAEALTKLHTGELRAHGIAEGAPPPETPPDPSEIRPGQELEAYQRWARSGANG